VSTRTIDNKIILYVISVNKIAAVAFWKDDTCFAACSMGKLWNCLGHKDS